MSRKSKNQSMMYLDGSDLPLFSMTAPTVTVDTFISNEIGGQDSLFAPACGCCLDTGKVDSRPCFCEAGDKYRKAQEPALPDNIYTAYIHRIRNAAKRDYATRYYARLCTGEVGEPPGRGDLGAMAAQSVRMELRRLHLP